MASIISAGTTSSTSLNLTADTSGVLQLASNNGTVAMSISTAQVVSFTNQPTFTGGTANGVAYLNGSKVLTTGSALVFDGTNLTTNAIKAGSNAGDVLFGRYDATYPTSGVGFFKLGTNNYDGDTGGFTLSTLDNGTLRTSYQVIETSGSASYHVWNASGSEQMRLTSTGLGIGTSSPSQKLSVTGNGTFTGYVTAGGGGSGLRVDGVLMADRDQDNNITLIGGADNTLRLRTGSTTRATIDSSGNLGLGVTPKTWSTGSSIEVGNYFLKLSGSSTYGAVVTNNAYYNAGWKYAEANYANMYQTLSGEHRWFNAPVGAASGNAITFTQAMTLDASGNLGVGTTSPAYKLDVLNAGGGEITRFGSSTRKLYFYADSGGVMVGTGATETGTSVYFNEASSFLYFQTNSIERARIDANGAITQTCTSSANSLKTTNSNGSPNGLWVQYSSAAPNGTGNEGFYFSDSGALRASIRSNGGLANYSGNNVNLSDRREKTNFAPAGDYLAKICAIPVQTFNYIDQNMEEDDGLTLGVVAQDVEAVAPELVMESNWAKEGEEPKMRLSIYQTDLQYALMKCIQEQQALIETLTTRITALEAK